MGLGGPANLRSRWLDDDATTEHVGGHDQKRDEDQRDKQPVEHERDEGQPEHVEADVVMELTVGNVEPLRVAEHQPVLPMADGGCGEEQAGEAGNSYPQQSQAV